MTKYNEMRTNCIALTSDNSEMGSNAAAMTVVDREMRSDSAAMTVIDKEIIFDTFEMMVDAFVIIYNAYELVFGEVTLRIGHVGSNGILFEYTSCTNEMVYGQVPYPRHSGNAPSERANPQSSVPDLDPDFRRTGFQSSIAEPFCKS